MSGVILYSSPFVPPEWIAAHGLRPRRIGPTTPQPARVNAAMGACAYAAMMPRMTADVAGMVMATTCDQMRRAAETIPGERFLLNVPATWSTPTGLRIYRDELERLGRWCCRLGGTAPSPACLAEQMRQHDDCRRELRRRAGLMHSRGYAESLSHYGETGELPPLTFDDAPRLPLALVGGPLCRSELPLLDMIESAGGRVVLDATETGERGLIGAYDQRHLHEAPFDEMAQTCFGSIADAFRRPDTHLHQWLTEQFARRSVRGVLVLRRTWCDLWHAQIGRLRELTTRPVIEVDVEYGGADLERARTRIESLLEVCACSN